MIDSASRVMVIDDNDVDREAVRRLVGREYAVDEASTANEGLRLAREQRPDCVLLDYNLPDGSGVDLVEALAAEGFPVVMLSGVGSESVAVAALKGGAQDYLSKDGLSAEALRVAVRGAIHRVALRRQVREQQQALELKASELARRGQELSILLDQLPAVVWTVDRALRVTSASGKQLSRLGLDAFVGRRLDEEEDHPLASEALLAQHRAAVDGSSSSGTMSHGGRSYDVTLQPLRGAAHDVIGAIGLLQDTTDQRRLEEQLRHSQRMEAMGRLAGGVAHDFNNLLTVVLNCAVLAKESLPPSEPAIADMDEILEAARRAAELTAQLLAFSRRRATRPEVIDVRRLLEGTVRMLHRLIGEDVRLETRIATDVGAVQIDPGSLEQVIVNLAVNARDAMPRGGLLLLDVMMIDIDTAWHDFHGAEITPGRYVRIVMNDTGVGMTPEVRSRLFEPFFSTKGPGRGTGLGLATVYGIVTQAGGALHVYSEPDRGTAFHVYLPVSSETPIRRPAGPPTATRGTETVLIVEDDPQIRSIARRVLADHGYEALVAATGEEALHVLGAATRVHLLVSDVVLPGLSGQELLARARALHPHLLTMLMSGYSPQIVALEGSDVPILQKPFAPTQLVSAVRRALDG